MYYAYHRKRFGIALTTLALVVVTAGIALEGWAIYLLIHRHGQLLLSQDELRDRLAALEGMERRLEDLLGEKPLLLAFFNPQCGFCTQGHLQVVGVGGWRPTSTRPSWNAEPRLPGSEVIPSAGTLARMQYTKALFTKVPGIQILGSSE